MKKKIINYIIMQHVYTHNNGNKCRCKRTFIQNIRMYSDHAKPIRSFVRLESLRLGEFIAQKGRLIKLNNKDFMTDDIWCEQFFPLSLNKTYILYAQVIFSNLPIVITYKIKFMYVNAINEEIEEFLLEIRRLIVSETVTKMDINGRFNPGTTNMFYRARMVLEKN